MVRHFIPALVLSCGLVSAGCTAGAVGGRLEAAAPPPAVTPSAPPVLRPSVSAPPKETLVLSGSGSGSLALATSRALYDDAPVVLLAAAEDLGAQAVAASVAVDLGTPLLLAPDPARPSAPARDDPVREELDRLGTTTVLTFDDEPTQWAAELDGDVAVVPTPTDPETLASVAGAELGPAQAVPARQLTDAVAALERDQPALLELARRAAPAERTTSARAPGTEARLPSLDAAPPLDTVTVLAPPAATAATATARAAGARVLVVPRSDPRADSAVVEALAEQPAGNVVALGEAFGAPDRLRHRLDVAATGVELPGGGQLLFPTRRLVALYGHPATSSLGVLGEQSLPATIRRARKVTAQYQPFSAEPVVPALEIITTVASSEAGSDGDYANEATVEELRPWVDEAGAAGVYVVLDLQPGTTDFLTHAKRYEELLAQPHVGLALDPEWRLEPGQRHLEQIGSVSAEEVNSVVTWLADLVQERQLPQKLLVLHQFQTSMLADRDQIDTSRDELAVLVQMDGYGPPGAKLATWRTVTAASPPGLWFGWKNFYDEDTTTFTPRQTLAVEPSPWFVSYQ